MKPINIASTITIKAASGKARRFSILAYSGGLLNVEGFPLPVIVDLAGLSTPNNVPILIDHTKSVEATLGITDSIVNDGLSLTLGGVVTGQSATAQQVIAQSAAGHTWQASIGAMVGDSEDIAAGQAVEVNGQTFVGPVIVARRATLKETSVLPMGADSTTTVNLAARAASFLKGSEMEPMTFESWVESLGLDASTLSPENTAAFQLAYESTMAPAAPVAAAPVVAPPVAAPEIAPTASAGASKMDIQATAAEGIKNANKLVAENMRRNAQIQAAAGGNHLIAATAIENGWSVEKVELEVLKASNAKTRPTSFSAAQNSPENMPNVIEAALCSTRGLTNNGRKPGVVALEAQYDDKTLQAAHSQYRGSVGLQQILIQCAAANGMQLQAGMKVSTGNIREVLSYACPQQGPHSLQAGFSTVSLPGILSNVANKEILQGYMEEDTTWREIAQIKSCNDFKTVTSYRMLDDMAYEKLPPGGTIKHGATGEESFTRAVDTYAKMYSLTRTDIINDDLGAFDDLRNRIGSGGAIKLNDLFWTTFLANLATIFTATRTNYITGSTTNLGTDGVGLGLGQKAWRSRRSSTTDGSKRIGGIAKFVLVPPELETIADALYQGRNLGAVKVSDGNTFANKYTPIVAEQLSDSAYSGYSTTAWYMLGDKSKGSPVVVSFLNGQETPTVESADADFNTLGIQFRGYHDFGADLGDGYLNALMSKGAA
jgi:hypothetical protein